MTATTLTPDVTAIIATARDYAEGAYTADAARMERALHPHLAKRAFFTNPQGKTHLHQMTALELVNYARDGHGAQPTDHRQADVTVLDVFQNVATVRLVMNDWVDYLQMARVDGRWVIINVLWEMKAN